MYKILGGKIMEYIKEYPNKIDKKVKAIFNMTGNIINTKNVLAILTLKK